MGSDEDFRVRAPRKLDHDRANQLIRPLIHHGADTDRPEGVLDFSGLKFITPFGLVALTAVLSCADYRFGSVRTILPEDKGCLSYLKFSGFTGHLPDFAKEETGQGQVSDPGSWKAQSVLPLTRLRSSEAVGEVGQKVRNRIDTMMGPGNDGWEAVKVRLASTAKEMCQNVFDHAQVDTGWVAAQRYSKPSPYIELAIGDAGRGIRASLSEKYPGLSKEREGRVLRRMLRERLSCRENRSAGHGYRLLQKAAEELDGQFQLRSGRGKANRSREGRLHTTFQDARWPGTHLMVRFACPA